MTNIQSLIDLKNGISLPEALQNLILSDENKFASYQGNHQIDYQDYNSEDYFIQKPAILFNKSDKALPSKKETILPDNERVKGVVEKANDNYRFSASNPKSSSRDIIRYRNLTVNRDFINAAHMNEIMLPFGLLTSKSISGIDIGDAKGHKTYGAGLLYDPDTNRLMDDVKNELGRNFTLQELSEKFMKLYLNNMSKAEKEMNMSLNLNLKEALASVIALYGHIPSSIKTAILSGNKEKIKYAWMHAHDNDKNYSKYKNGWDKRSMWEYNWFIGNKYKSALSDEIKTLLKLYKL